MRDKKWTKEKLTEELQILHRDFCTIANDPKSKTCHKDFLKYIGEKRSDVKSAIANANRAAKVNGKEASRHYLEDYGISPWCHLKIDPPFGESEVEELETWKYFAQKLIDLEIELSKESITKKPNAKLIIPPPPRYSAENYPECKRHKCENQENYGISVHALYQRAEKRFKAKPGGGYAYMLSLAGLNYHEDIKKQEMRSPISKIEVEPIDFFSRYILELLLESNDTDISKEAECILNAASGINGIELRRIFESDCLPDTSAAKQRVNTLINKFNEDKHGRLLFLLKKDIKNRDYSEDIYANMMAELHSRWHRNRVYRLNKIPFDYDFICKESPELRAWVDSKGVGMRYAYEVSGINPDCHMTELYLGKTEKEIKENATYLLKLLAKQIGIMSLNVGSLTGGGEHSETLIEIPSNAEVNKDKFPHCHKFSCEPILPRAGTFYVRCQTIFGSWEKALKGIGINYEEIKRKAAKRDSEYYLSKLGEIVKNNPGWTVKSIKNSNPPIYRGIYNLERRGLLRFLDRFEGNDVMKAAIFEERFITSNSQLSIKDYCDKFKDEFEDDWRRNNRRNIDDEQRKRGHAFEKWFKQSLIMNGFSELTDKDESLLSHTNFIHEKHIFSIDGDSKEYRKPDFLFKDMIIDTKTTFTEDEKTIQQFKAYSTIRKNLYCVTLRQDSIKKFPNDNFEVTLVSIDNIDTKIPMLMDCCFDEDLLERHLDNVLQDVIKD